MDRFLFSPGKKLIGFVVRGFSRRGLLAQVAALFAENGLNISYCSTRAAGEGERGWILFFVDFTNSQLEPFTLAEELLRLPFIERVEVIEPRVEGFIADTSFPLTTGATRAVLLDESALKGLLLRFREKLGSGGEAMLYHIGLELGKERWRYILRMAEEIGAEDFSEKLSIVADVFRSMGYGIMRIKELEEEKPYARFEVLDCIECSLGRPSKSFFSQFVRGLLAGITSIIYNTNMHSRETMCIAVGDPHCEFEITPQRR